MVVGPRRGRRPTFCAKIGSGEMIWRGSSSGGCWEDGGEEDADAGGAAADWEWEREMDGTGPTWRTVWPGSRTKVKDSRPRRSMSP